MDKKRIIIITNLYPNSEEPLRGVFVESMAKELKELCDLTVISPLPWFPKGDFLKRFGKWHKYSLVNNSREKDGIKIYYPKFIAIPKMGIVHSFFMFIAIFSLVNKLHKQKPIDLINAHWIFPDGVAANWVAQFLKIPIVLSAHGCDINHYPKLFMRKTPIVRALAKANGISVVSSAQKTVVEKMGIVSAKIQVVRNGVDFKLFKLRDKIACRKKYGLEPDMKMILFVGQIIEVKGIEFLIEAFSSIAPINPEYKLFLIGQGHLRQKYEEVILARGLSHSLLFKGEISREEIPYWFGASDALCLPSIREGCPTVILEALACGKPIVASKVGGIPELINDKNGILVEARDPKALAAALTLALNRPWDEIEIQRSVPDYSWQAVAGRYFALFDSVLNNIKDKTKVH
jgi:teichuronic acid biosynthesis glycosyltransferase TuaC